MRMNRIKIPVFIGLMLLITAFTSLALAEGSQEEESFLFSDPDGDGILTWEEFVRGSDPYNSDSDNDGLPDDWEFDFFDFGLNPGDSSDAHEDIDYYPPYNTSKSESEASFEAIKTYTQGDMVWPSNPTIRFIDKVFDEDGTHYDNYEEYYRPYTAEDGAIKIMKTYPNDPDCDDDDILDPDDFEPFNYANDGTGVGGVDSPVINKNKDLDSEPIKIQENNKEIDIIVELSGEAPDPVFVFDIDVLEPNQQPPAENKDYAADIDNDGI